ncbi:SNF2 helicase associated domain-containing protein [Alloiococcus sp. CFN-8]|uniref:SNF2 helicase associated domain-containing protein n=1 Tax=Alloiococcus sp. CFN-8 TaxID=3416081 RepID=UPI003CEDBE90
MYLDIDTVKDWLNNLDYKKALKYYNEGYVETLSVFSEDSIWKEDNNVDRISGNVISFNGFNTYNVNVRMDNKGRRLSANCSCEEKKSNSPCSHIGAVLLKYINENQGAIIAEKQSKEIDALINNLKNAAQDNNEYKREVDLEFKLFDDTNTYRPSLELKIGTGKLYVVKSLKKFLSSLSKEEPIEFGKNFVLEPSLHKFSATDDGIIRMLLELWEVEEEIELPYGRSAVYHTSIFSGKKLLLTDKLLYRFLSLASGRTITAEIGGIEYSDVKILLEDLPVSFKLSMEHEAIELLQQGKLPHPIDNSRKSFFYQGSIYIPSEKQLKIYDPILSLLQRKKDNKLLIQKSEGDMVASYLLPMVKKAAKEVTLDESIREAFYEGDLLISTYLDKKGDFVTASLKFKYDDIEIDPLIKESSSHREKILIRDIEREENCQKILESFGFKKDKEIYLMTREGDIAAFIHEGIESLQELSEVYYSESFKNIRIYGKSSLMGGIRLNKENLLEFTFDLEGIDRSELVNIFSAIREKKKYYRLKKGGFVALEEQGIKDLKEVVDYLGVNDKELLKDNILLSKYNALYLDQKIKDSDMDFVVRSKDFRELTNSFKDVKDMDYYIPEHLYKVMRNYQRIGFKWLKTLAHYGFGGILADEMGLGKTLQTIAFLATEKGEKPSLVIAPTSLLYNWEGEIEKFAPELKVLVLSGSKKQREELMEEVSKSDVVITSYPLIRRDVEEYKNIDFKYCILDEAQQIKNAASINAASVKSIKAEGYFALTGTPMENSLSELWSIFDFIMPGYLLNHGKFTKLYETPIVKNQDKKALEELNRHIKPFILRRLKKDVLKELPPKIEHSLIVDMTEEQKKLYAAYLDSARSEINEEIKDKGFNKSKIKIFSVLTRLRQICCDPSVFIENYQGDSGKLLALYDLLEDSIEEGHKILLFSQFTSVLKNIGSYLDEKGLEYLYLDGNTKSEDRASLVKEFNNGSSKIFLISLKAGGTGLNLTGADTVIHFDPWWNPAVEDQATDRAHRIGQEKTVEVIKLLAKGTIEEKIFKLQEEKKKIIKDVINEELKEAGALAQLTQEDLVGLFQ